MARFGWAYVDCDGAADGGSGSKGPPNSIQFVTGSGPSGGHTTGSLNLTFVTGGVEGSSGTSHILYLTGTLIVSDTISASHYHISDVTEIDSTGSTYFGNTNDDLHVRTGSLSVHKAGTVDGADYILSASAIDESVRVRAFGGQYHQVLGSTSYNVQSKDYIIGIAEPNNVTVTLPRPSASNSGRLLIIKDEYVNRRTGSITVTGSTSGFHIDMIDKYILTGSYPAISLYSNGTNWFVF